MTATLLPTGHELVCWHDAADTPCEPGILARCSICRLFFAPCTRTPIKLADVLDRVWTCRDCTDDAAPSPDAARAGHAGRGGLG